MATTTCGSYDDVLQKYMGSVEDSMKESAEHSELVSGGFDMSSVAGGSSHIGGLKDVKDYHKSIHTLGVQKLIRGIAEDFEHKLHVPELKTKGKSLEEVVEQLHKHVPDPRPKRGNKKQWSVKEASQVKACETLGEIINDRLGAKVINMNQKPHELCEDVAELMDSLVSGFSSEFSGVRKDVERLLKNINLLQKMLERNYQTLNHKIASVRDDDDTNIRAETALVREAHDDIRTELARQISMLQNMLNVVIEPAEKDLAVALKDNKDLKTLVRKIKAYPGESKMGEKIAYALSGTRTVATAAKIVDDALTKLGLSYAEYSKAHTGKDLSELLSKKTQDSLNKGDQALHNYFKAVRAINRLQYMHDDIVDELKNKKRGRGEEAAESTGDAEMHEYAGGADEVATVKGGLKLDKRVKRVQENRKNLVRAFSQRLSLLMDQLLVSAKAAAESIGSGKVKLTDNLEKFGRALELIPNIQQKNIYMSLSGIYTDIHSKEERERFISASKYVMATIDDVMKDAGSSAGHFKDMKSSLQQIIQLIQDYSSKFTDEPAIIDPYMIKQREKSGANEESYSGGDDVEGGDFDTIIPEITRISMTLEKVKEIIMYYFRTSKIRTNLSKFSTEVKSYGEDYIKILADAIANSIDSVSRQQQDYLTTMENADENGPRHALRAELILNEKTATVEKKEKVGNIIKFQKKLFETKVLMYRIAEAVDLYMKAFTDGIASDPDSIKSIMKILDRTEVISRWFTNTSGDMLCNVFDSFPSYYEGHIAKYSKLPKYSDDHPAEHYYTRVRNHCHTDDEFKSLPNNATSAQSITAARVFSLPGNPYLGAPIEAIMGGKLRYVNVGGNPDDVQVKGVLSYVDKALSVSVLKNLIAAFVNIGNDFGGKELTKQIHMSPVQLYHGLMQYITYSAFRMGSSTPGAFLQTNRSLENVNQIPLTWRNDAVVTRPRQLAKARELAMIRNGPNPTEAQIEAEMANALRAIGRAADSKGDTQDISVLLPGGLDAGSTTIPANNTIRTGTTGAANLDIAAQTYDQVTGVIGANGAAPNPNERRFAYVMMRGVDPKLYTAPDLFQETDQLFVMVIKSIVAKILTTIGVFNMFNRPINQHGLGYFSGLRLIIGGASDTPKVIPEALELYIRLPLLAEFYRDIFNFKETDVNKMREISLIPEMEGTFSGLISLIFDKAAYVENGAYSDTDMRILIEEVNKIYSKYRNTTEAINEFVAEVNRRYGVIKQDERKRYLDDRRDRYKDRYAESERTELTDFEIAGIDENDDFARPAPSLSYQTEGGIGTARSKGHKYKLQIESDTKNVNQLRSAIDNLFKDAQESVMGGSAPYNPDMDEWQTKLRYASLSNMIKARSEEMKHTKTDQERYQLVQSVINSLGQFSTPALVKSYVLFHEMVVAPLNVLHGLYIMLKAFYDKIDGMDKMFDEIEDWLKAVPAGSTVTAGTSLVSKPNVAVYRHGAGTNGDIIVPTGRQYNVGVDIGYNTLDGLINVAGGNQSDVVKDVVKRFAVNQDKILKVLVETLFGHASTLNKFVDMNIEVSRTPATPATPAESGQTCRISIRLDHSKLHQHIQDVFSSVKQSLDKFRGLLPKGEIDKYELYQDSTTGVGAQNVGSLYWLEKNLIEDLIQGHAENDPNSKNTLDRTNKKIQRVLEYLTNKWTVDITHIVNPATPKVAASYHQFDDVIYEMVFYSLRNIQTDFYTAVAGGEIDGYKSYTVGTPPTGSISRLLYNNTGRKKGNVNSGALWADSPPGHTTYIYDDSKGFNVDDTRHGAFIMFNRLVAAYISQVYDEPTNKFYLTALNAFANGAFSASVMGDKIYTDFQAIATNDIYNNQTAGTNGVLCKSLAIIIRHMLTDTNPTGDKKFYAESDLAEIPLYLKERYKASFPIFHKMFQILIKRCEFLKELCKAINIAQPAQIAYPVGVNNRNLSTGAPIGGLAGGNINAVANKVDNERRMVAILDAIIQGSMALCQCINDTMKELVDDPKYYELGNDFIQNYESMNGQYPFMPHSSLLYALKSPDYAITSTGADNSQLNYFMLPIFKVGDPLYKNQYGTRKVLNNDDIKIDDLPGVKDLIKQHNNSTDSKFHFDEKLVSGNILKSLDILKYMIDAKRYRSEFMTWLGSAATAPTANNSASHVTVDLLGNNKINNDRAVYSLQTDTILSDVVKMTESNNQKDQKNKIASLIKKRNECEMLPNRKVLVAFNIIDLNIVPINVHALMREIPLINLYNYSWTFDKLIGELFRVDPSLEVPMDEKRETDVDTVVNMNSPCAKNGKHLLSCLMVRPYMQIDQDVYELRLSQIMRGDLGIEGLAQPKYLGQEVYNKALFGEMYPGQVYRDQEEDPGLGDAHLRGKREVLGDAVLLNPNNVELSLFQSLLIHYITTYCGGGADGYQGSAAGGDVADIATALRPLYTNGGVLRTSGLSAAALTAAIAPASAFAISLAGSARPPEVQYIALAAAQLLSWNKSELSNVAREILAQHPAGHLWTAAHVTAALNALPATTQSKLLLTDQILQAIPGGGVVAVAVAGISAADINSRLTGIAYVAPAVRPLQAAMAANGAIAIINASLPGLINNNRRGDWNDLPRSNRFNIESTNRRYFPEALHYMEIADPKTATRDGRPDFNNDAVVKEVSVTGFKTLLQVWGKLRFDTKLNRNLMWITNIQRMLRLKLRRDLMWYDTKVVDSHATLASGITELYGNDLNPSRMNTGAYSY
jgi:hypothetical protein